ncbi:hypothetical protein K435DRAFT_858450 [Dendrothele bispora CBS 962.96]|uniref:SUN domain-containing protein n=1 Tax=Dendrothele bispora (strain CBS 962.96) TaxID=1314807 RepID=A0A4S8M303_DENBC|nr:hypothetical protein K435DRAFT_858450 [Dendrothele bispora CBS 962.96]
MIPFSLLLLLFTSPVFSLSFSDSFSVKPAPKTPQDQFHAISAHAPKKDEPPVCCLVPLPPIPSDGEPVAEELEDVLLSFGEWKERERQMEQKQGQKQVERDKDGVSGSAEESNMTSLDEHPVDDPSENTTDPIPAETLERLSPHFQVPLVDRFNYASLDCSARVHASHRSAKSPSNILSSKRDRYMLSPCAGKSRGNNIEQQFVVVELCEDIRIDTVQLANFEFFSGVFRDFTVSVAKSYLGETKKQVWVHAGTYRAKNVRGVQSFHPPRSLTDFYRVIRIDFHSHYSNEYYCPISLLRVYGLTHLEEWKWEMWEAESMVNGQDVSKLEIITTQQLVDEEQEKQTEIEMASTLDETLDSGSGTLSPQNDAHGGTTISVASDSSPTPIYIFGVTTTTSSPYFSELPSTTTFSASSESSLSSPIPSTPNQQSFTDSDAPPLPSILLSMTSVSSTSDTLPSSQSTTEPASSSIAAFSSTRSSHSISVSGDVPNSDSSGSVDDNTTADVTISSSADPHPSSSLPSSHSSSYASSSSTSSVSDHSSNTSHSIPIPSFCPFPFPFLLHSLCVISGGGESIYRTIMNRLTALEGNHSLYTRYVEQQTTTIRAMLSRLSEDVGRLETISKSQSAALIRERRQRERERLEKKRLEAEFGELISRVEYLSDEITLEKRLGIAQLCILLTVIVFMGLTRGSRGEIGHHDHRLRGRWSGDLREMMSRNGERFGFREWGRRQLSISFSGLSGLGRGRSRGGSTSTSEERVSENEPRQKQEKEVNIGREPVVEAEVDKRIKREDPSQVSPNRIEFPSSPSFNYSQPNVKPDESHDKSRYRTPLTTPASAPPLGFSHDLSFGLDDSSSSSYHTANSSRSPSNDQRPKTAGLLSDRSRSRTPLSDMRIPRTPTRDTHTPGHTQSRATHFNTSTKEGSLTRTSRPRLQRSNSHGSSPTVHIHGHVFGPGISASQSWASPGQAPKSVKKWARTAHLHEVKKRRDKVDKEEEKKKEKEKEKEEDVFSSNTGSGTPRRSRIGQTVPGNVFGDVLQLRSIDFSTSSSTIITPNRTRETFEPSSPRSDEDPDTDTSWVDTETETEAEGELGGELTIEDENETATSLGADMTMNGNDVNDGVRR